MFGKVNIGGSFKILIFFNLRRTKRRMVALAPSFFALSVPGLEREREDITIHFEGERS